MWRVVIIVAIFLAGCKSRQKLGKNIYPNCKYGMYSKEEVIQKSDSTKTLQTLKQHASDSTNTLIV